MTGAQEAILDELMAAADIGVSWAHGRATRTTSAVGPDGATRRDVAQSLGYPSLLRAAVVYAVAALQAVDERRKLAISVVSEVAPRRRAPRVPPKERLRLGLWAARRVHPLVCR